MVSPENGRAGAGWSHAGVRSRGPCMCRYGTHTLLQPEPGHRCNQPLLPFTSCLAHGRRSADAPSMSVSVGNPVTGLTQQERGAQNPAWEPLASLSPIHLPGAQDRAGAPFPAQRELRPDGNLFTGGPLWGRGSLKKAGHISM